MLRLLLLELILERVCQGCLGAARKEIHFNGKPKHKWEPDEHEN